MSDMLFPQAVYTYKLLALSGVQRLEDGLFIPEDDANPYWRTYQDWLAAGNVPQPADPPPPPPVAWKVPRLQVINRLADAGKFAAFMDSLDDSTQLKRELWHALAEIPNDSAFIIELLNEAGADPAVILARP